MHTTHFQRNINTKVINEKQSGRPSDGAIPQTTIQVNNFN